MWFRVEKRANRTRFKGRLMADAEKKGKRGRSESDQEVGNKVRVQTRSGGGAATKRPRQATIKHGTGNGNVDDEHGAGGIPLQHDNTDDDSGCCRVFKNKRLRDLFVEPTFSNFDDQSGQLELSEGQLPYSYEGSSLEKSKSRILGSTRSTATSDPFYTAEEVEREVAYALARQEIWHRAEMDDIQKSNAKGDHSDFLIKTLFDQTGFDLPEYPGISGEMQDVQGKPSNPHQ